MAHAGWIAVDLDRTLAVYTSYQGPFHIGAPIMAMVERVKSWRAQGIEVRIFTARANPKPYATPAQHMSVITNIQTWSMEHIGEVLPVTHEKDFNMMALYDDRAVGVEPNTGRLLSEPHRH